LIENLLFALRVGLGGCYAAVLRRAKVDVGLLSRQLSMPLPMPVLREELAALARHWREAMECSGFQHFSSDYW